MGISVKVTMVMMATRWIGRIYSSEREDMAVVTAMMREAAVDGVTLRVEGMHPIAIWPARRGNYCGAMRRS